MPVLQHRSCRALFTQKADIGAALVASEETKAWVLPLRRFSQDNSRRVLPAARSRGERRPRSARPPNATGPNIGRRSADARLKLLRYPRSFVIPARASG